MRSGGGGRWWRRSKRQLRSRLSALQSEKLRLPVALIGGAHRLAKTDSSLQASSSPACCASTSPDPLLIPEAW